MRSPRSWNDLFAWLNESFDALGIARPINLVGMSFGGALAAQYALHFPERVNRAVLLAPGAIVLRFRAGFIARLILAAIASRRGLPRMIRWMFADMARKDPGWIDETLELLFTAMRSLDRRRLPLPPVWTDEQWDSLKPPTLFLVGEHETIYSAAKAVRRLRRLAPRVTAEIIPASGHDLTFAQPEMINRRILQFLGEEPVRVPSRDPLRIASRP